MHRSGPRSSSSGCRAPRRLRAPRLRGARLSALRYADETRGLAGLILLETNTQPGMTPTSLTPEQADKVGMGFGALCRLLVEDASCNR